MLKWASDLPVFQNLREFSEVVIFKLTEDRVSRIHIDSNQDPVFKLQLQHMQPYPDTGKKESSAGFRSRIRIR
jgi:hypothetical protein